MSGYVGDLSDKQSRALRQFRENLRDVLKEEHDDHYLLRWLRARRFDLMKSEKMLRESLKWREENGADTILADWTPPELLLAYYPGGLFGCDKQGHPIYIEPVGYADPRGMLQSVTKSDVIKYKIRDCERIQRSFREQSAKLNRHMEGLVIILDLEKYGLRHLWKTALDIYTHVLAIFEANYPETLHRTYVVNAPKIFPIAYNLTKPFLSADTKEKVHVLGKNWKHRLLEVIDADQLPVHWGGTATDPDGDPYCRSQVCMGGEIPSHHYTNHLENVDISQFITKTLGRGSSLELEYPIQRQNTVLRWQFFTEGSDLSFSIARQGSTSAGEGEPQSSSKAEAVEEIVKPCRVNSHLIPESGSLVCTIPATYIIKFDNSYSWVKSKKLSYLIEVLPPADITELHTSPSFAIPRGDSSAQLSMD